MMKCFILLALMLSCSSQKSNVTPPPPVAVVVPPPVVAKPGEINFQSFESEVLTDLTGLVSAEQINARYITICDQLNSGRLTPELRRGVQKALNQISLEVEVEPGDWIGADSCTLRIDLRDFGLTPTKWRAIERDDPLKFESFTDRGQLIKQLTQTRRAWVLGSVFTETVLTKTYYELIEVPYELDPFLAGLGCNLQRDFDDFSEDLYLAGLRRSLIALQKNRTILMTDCRDGVLTSTYDFILEEITSSQRNLSINPFPKEARSNATFIDDAQEFIFTLPNGLYGYALFAKGLRQDFAPTNVVVDNLRADIDPTIRNSRSCSACHSQGLLPAEDFIAEHVKGNSGFNSQDIQRAQAYFGRNAAMQAKIRESNGKFTKALEVINAGSGPDPINQLTDKIRREMSLSQIAGMLFLTADELREKLPASPKGIIAIGQLLNEGSINFQDLVQIKDILIEDLNLFQEDLGQ